MPQPKKSNLQFSLWNTRVPFFDTATEWAAASDGCSVHLPRCFGADIPMSCKLPPVQPADVKKTFLSLPSNWLRLMGRQSCQQRAAGRCCPVPVPVLYLSALRSRKLGHIWGDRGHSTSGCSWGCSECMDTAPNPRPCCSSLRSVQALLLICSLREQSQSLQKADSHPGKAVASLGNWHPASEAAGQESIFNIHSVNNALCIQKNQRKSSCLRRARVDNNCCIACVASHWFPQASSQQEPRPEGEKPVCWFHTSVLLFSKLSRMCSLEVLFFYTE